MCFPILCDLDKGCVMRKVRENSKVFEEIIDNAEEVSAEIAKHILDESYKENS